MKRGPGDYEIDEIGLEEILEGIIPGSDMRTDNDSPSNDAQTTETTVDDPLGW